MGSPPDAGWSEVLLSEERPTDIPHDPPSDTATASGVDPGTHVAQPSSVPDAPVGVTEAAGESGDARRDGALDREASAGAVSASVRGIPGPPDEALASGSEASVSREGALAAPAAVPTAGGGTPVDGEAATAQREDPRPEDEVPSLANDPEPPIHQILATAIAAARSEREVPAANSEAPRTQSEVLGTAGEVAGTTTEALGTESTAPEPSGEELTRETPTSSGESSTLAHGGSVTTSAAGIVAPETLPGAAEGTPIAAHGDPGSSAEAAIEQPDVSAAGKAEDGTAPGDPGESQPHGQVRGSRMERDVQHDGIHASLDAAHSPVPDAAPDASRDEVPIETGPTSSPSSAPVPAADATLDATAGPGAGSTAATLDAERANKPGVPEGPSPTGGLEVPDDLAASKSPAGSEGPPAPIAMSPSGEDGPVVGSSVLEQDSVERTSLHDQDSSITTGSIGADQVSRPSMPLKDVRTSPSVPRGAEGGGRVVEYSSRQLTEDEAALAVREAASRAAAQAGMTPGNDHDAVPIDGLVPTDVSRETFVAPPAVDDLRIDPAAAARNARVLFRIDSPVDPSIRRILAVANQKGGVGKSTTAVNLGAYLALAGAQVLVVDLDPQGNASTGLGLDHRDIEPSVYDVLSGTSSAAEAIRSTSLGNLHLLPSTIDLAGAEVELVSAMSRESRLRRSLEAINQRYDIVLIDCPPSLGLLTVNALAAADELLIPIQCEYYALEGLGQLLRNVELVRANLNPDLRIGGIALTMYDGRTRLAEQVVDEVRKHFADLVYQTVIPRSVRLSEAPGYGLPIALYDPLSRGGIAYRDLALELAERSGLLAPTGEGAS
jgi:chromosome partitioning protein